jgi:hypothetical protein
MSGSCQFWKSGQLCHVHGAFVGFFTCFMVHTLGHVIGFCYMSCDRDMSCCIAILLGDWMMGSGHGAGSLGGLV